MISFSHAYKYAATSSADKLVPDTEHLSLTCHPNSISSSSFHPPPGASHVPSYLSHDLSPFGQLSGVLPPHDPPPPGFESFTQASLFAFR